jgi:acyl-CoA synthetase (NDP forming)
MAHYLDAVINPRSIAIIGASADPSKRGYRAIKGLLTEGYTGQILPVNPKESEILGLKCYPSLADVPGEVDLAFVCTPAASAPTVVEACGKKGVKGALIVAGGFGEAHEEGRLLEEKTVALGRQYNVRLIGPNTNGLFSARNGCNTLGIADVPRGGLVMLANSANVILSMVTEAQHGHMGINTMFSIGNQADIEFSEYLECFGEDPAVTAIVSYVEGFKNAPAYLAMAKQVTRKKPIVMFVAGRSNEGREAAKSHSGSLAGDYHVSKGVLAQAGVTLLTRADELYPVAEALSLFPPMRGRRVGLLSEGGGAITVAAEALAERGLTLPILSKETQAKIHAVVPNASAISNPVDSGGGTDPRAEYCGPIARAMLEDPNVDALFIAGFFGGYGIRLGAKAGAAEAQVCAELARMMREYGKPIIVQSHYLYFKPEPLEILRKGGVPTQRHIEIAAQCLASAADHYAAGERNAHGIVRATPARPQSSDAIIERCRAEGRNPTEPEARDLLLAAGLKVPPHAVMKSAGDASAVSKAMGDAPCAVKVVSADVSHKSDAGGVKLNVAGGKALAEAFEELRANVSRHVPGANIEGMLVTPMARKGTEVIIGVTRDPQYGPVIMFGLGGVFVEVIRDVVFRSLPLSDLDAAEMIGALRYGAMLDGVRGAPAVDRAALRDLLLDVSAFAMAHPELAELDLNPVIADDRGYTIVDARGVLSGA